MFYFFSYNLDERKVNITMKENDFEFYNNRFQINKSREFRKEIIFTGKPIEVKLEFYDGHKIYKTEIYKLDSRTLHKYKQTGTFKWLNKKPKIKLVHLQTIINDEREQKSREDLQRLKEYGIEYVLHTNQPYGDLPPKFNCIRPDCVSMELFDEDTLYKNGGQTALTPAHYGCFESFKNAILSEFDDCDFLILAEGDCKIDKPIEDFAKAIFESARLCNENNIGFFSFGDVSTLEHGWLQSKVIETIPNQDLMFVTNHIIGIQSIMFPKFTKDWLKDMARNHKWDAADIWFNTIFKKSPYKMGIVHNRFTSQYDGISLIDQQFKKFR